MTAEPIESNEYRSRVGSYASGGPMPRTDAAAKASGTTVYAGDVTRPDMAYASCARSTMPHARIVSIDTTRARTYPGVIGVFTAADVSSNLYGRGVCDMPVLAEEKVRFVGERVAAVVASTRRRAEEAADLIEIEYEPLPTIATSEDALAPDAPPIHDRPWSYELASAREGDHPNVMYHHARGFLEDFEEAFNVAAHRIDQTYVTQSVHQGYLETQACLAEYEGAGANLWLTTKMPYSVRTVLSVFSGLPQDTLRFNPIALGGDFGAKGGPQDSPLCLELSRLTGRPVKTSLRYNEELIAANPRHPSQIRVRLACDENGRFVAVALEAIANGGAYAGVTPSGSGPHGFVEVPSYTIPIVYTNLTRVYTNTVPRGNMRAPGAPQGIFAFESAIDELAHEAGLDPVDVRRRNLLETGDTDVAGAHWLEHRGRELLDVAMRNFAPRVAPEGWRYGRGIAIYSRQNPFRVSTSLRLVPLDDGCMRVETPFIETGTGAHTVLREMIADRLGFQPEDVEIANVTTDSLPRDSGPGGSRVTSGFSIIADAAGKAWVNRVRDEPIVIDMDEEVDTRVGSYTVQIAQVAVDPETGEMQVLEIFTVQDIANIINPLAHQMQLDGGAAMGYGYCMLEDLGESEGQVWAANLGEFKLPSHHDVPNLRTLLLPGGKGIGASNVKGIGESSTPPTAPAIANALYAATGVRLRELPLTAERIYKGLYDG